MAHVYRGGDPIAGPVQCEHQSVLVPGSLVVGAGGVAGVMLDEDHLLSPNAQSLQNSLEL